MERTRWIRIQPSTETERKVPLRSRLLLGRGPEVDIALDDTAASRQHLRITEEAGAVWVEDLGSTNGTWLVGSRLVGTQRWVAGEVLQVGRTTLLLEESVSADEPPTIHRGIAWIRVLSRSKVRRALRLVGVGAIGVGLLSLGLGGLLPSERALANLPTPPLPVGPGTKDLSFGAGEDVDLHVGKELSLVWEPRHPPEQSVVRLVFEVEAEAEASFVVSLNGRELDGRRVPGGGRPARLAWVLPAADIRTESINHIVLHHVHESPSLRWVGWALELREEPRPPCGRETCIEEAEQALERGRLALEREALDPAQTYEAWALIERSIYYLEALQPPPPLLVEAKARLDEVEVRLERRCKTGRFAVVQALAFGKEDRARHEAEALLRAFPREGHRCHEQAKDLLRRLDPGRGDP